MKIIGNGKQCRKIRVSHLGEALIFFCKFEPMSVDEQEKSGCAEIVFSDTKEIDQLIEILSRLKNGCESHIGQWGV